MASKRKSLGVDEKVLLKRAIETGEKITDVFKRFGFSRSTVYTIWKNNQSVIKSLKGHYRKKLLMELVESEGKSTVNMLHTVNFLSKAWEEVTPTTIQHSLRNAGLTTASLTDKEILDSVRKTEDQQQGDEEDEIDEPEPPPSIKEALEAAKLLENYFFYHQVASISQDINKITKKIQQQYWCSKTRH